MGAPAWLTGIFAALMLTVAAYCAGRLAVARRWRRPTELDTDAGHVLMGVAMAGMLVARLRILPAAAWMAVFAAGGAWFTWQLVTSRRPANPQRAAAASWRCPHPVTHLVGCAAMLYMLGAAAPLAARTAAAGMAALTPSRFSFLPLLMALFMVGYVVRVADRLPVRAPVTDRLPVRAPAADRLPLRVPALAIAPAASASAPATASAPVAASAPPDVTAPPAHVRPHLAPRCAALCKIAMGLTMAYMLVMML
jgi:Domain of unknown function (DUF5134)